MIDFNKLTPCTIDGKDGYVMRVAPYNFVLYDANKKPIFPIYPKVVIPQKLDTLVDAHVDTHACGHEVAT